MKYIIFYFLLIILTVNTRGPLHFSDPIPTVSTHWAWQYPEQKIYFPNLSDKSYKFSSNVITEFPLFKLFNHEYLKDNYLPEGTITFRHNAGSIESRELEKILQKLFVEILQKKCVYSEFTPLKQDFNVKKQAGLLILKAKKYPLVVKVFMETPRSFFRPYNKGFDPLMQFGIGGGITRHLLGFSRIKNQKTIMNMINNSDEWKDIVDTPRKWYWLPEYPWITLKAINLGPDASEKEITLPGAYVIVADYIDAERKFKMRSYNDCKKIISLCNFLQCRIDPNIPNFLVEKGTGKIVIIDTEHFPSLVGLQKPFVLKSYGQYYFDLGIKYLKERVFPLKYQRKARQKSGYVPFCLP